MAASRLYLDEDVHTFIAEAIRLRGYEATTTRDQHRLGAEDADQLAFTQHHGYTLVTYNVHDYPRLQCPRLSTSSLPVAGHGEASRGHYYRLARKSPAEHPSIVEPPRFRECRGDGRSTRVPQQLGIGSTDCSRQRRFIQVVCTAPTGAC